MPNGKKATQGCPCGFLGHPRKACKCAPGDIQRYQAKLSGPILDRIDLRVEVQAPPQERVGKVGDPAESVRLSNSIAAARSRQAERYDAIDGVHCNAQADPRSRRAFMQPRHEAAALLRRAMTRWDLSVRAYERTLAVARSIADLDGASDVDVHHVAEALQYRLAS